MAQAAGAHPHTQISGVDGRLGEGAATVPEGGEKSLQEKQTKTKALR